MSQDPDLDLRGLHCPVSTMRLKKFLKSKTQGGTFIVLSTDKEARVDFAALVMKFNGSVNLTSCQEWDAYTITLRPS